LRLVTPLEAGAGGGLVLPGVVLWALGLNEGDLVAAEPREGTTGRVNFRGYGERVRRAIEGYSHPWPWVEELLRLPMAAVGPEGTLALPEEIAGRLALNAPGDLLLSAWVERGSRGFAMERRVDGRRASPELRAEASYTLPVGPDFRIALPADALWALSLEEETVPLPGLLRASLPLNPESRVTLVVSLFQQTASFRLEPCPDLS
jgi:hypothetical protein